MGEAFDKDGHVLGEAFGETKREVFDELIRKHPDAHEIRIRSIGGVTELPRYQCHKEVRALKIAAVIDSTERGNESDGSRLLRFEDANFGPLRVDQTYVWKHKPQAGGYYVIYKDGYRSFSPADAFEEGYTRI